MFTFLLLSTSLLAVRGSTSGNSTFTCLNNYHILVTVDDDSSLELVALEYGNCTLESAAVNASTTEAGHVKTFTVQINPFDCRHQYSPTHVFSMALGAKADSSSPALIMKQLNFNSECVVASEQIVVFDYTALRPAQHNFTHTETSGIAFSIRAFDGGWDDANKLDEPPKRGGDVINLGMFVADDTFQHCDLTFAVEECTYSADTTAGFLNYTLFSSASGCANDNINVAVGYEPGHHMWTVSHILFLLGSMEEATGTLSCKVHTCPMNDPTSKCAEIAGQCLDSSDALVDDSCSDNTVTEEQVTCTTAEISDGYPRGTYNASCPYCYQYSKNGKCVMPYDIVLAHADQAIDGYAEIADGATWVYRYLAEHFNANQGINVVPGQTVDMSGLRLCSTEDSIWLFIEVEDAYWVTGHTNGPCYGINDPDCGCPEDATDPSQCPAMATLSGKFTKLCSALEGKAGTAAQCVSHMADGFFLAPGGAIDSRCSGPGQVAMYVADCVQNGCQ